MGKFAAAIHVAEDSQNTKPLHIGGSMEIGKPQREIYIEPLELPEPLRPEPSIEPSYAPEEVPVEEPVTHGTTVRQSAAMGN